MHPAFSVIFFTVTAGTGYGVLIWLALARVSTLVPDISAKQIAVMGFIGLVLVSAGLVSSTFHLANPKNAWRSFTRFRTSWLSREAVFAVLFYPLSLLWLGVEYIGNGDGNVGTVSQLLAILTAVLALVVLICTAMIYASLKTIRQWNTALTPVNFLLLSLLMGSLVLLLMLAHQGLTLNRLLLVALVVLFFAATVKIIYYCWIGQPAGPTINTALGFTRATVRLLDVGHSGDTFLTKEFGFQLAKVKLLWLRVITILLAFFVPGILVSGWLIDISLATLILAAISAYAGIFVERWLFFAEARHVVNLYHGAQRT